MTRAVGIKELKNKLSEYLRIVQTGETVLVTDRNKVIAQLTAPSEAGYMVSEPWREQAIREGWLTPAKNPGAPLRKPKGVMPLEDILRDLDESRKDQWTT